MSFELQMEQQLYHYIPSLPTPLSSIIEIKLNMKRIVKNNNFSLSISSFLFTKFHMDLQLLRISHRPTSNNNRLPGIPLWKQRKNFKGEQRLRSLPNCSQKGNQAPFGPFSRIHALNLAVKDQMVTPGKISAQKFFQESLEER